jgi:hypothetical protein
MSLKKIIFSFALPGLFLISSLSLSTAQNTFQTFGKSRVQYKKFYWRSLSTANFNIYYYDNGSRLANFATRFLETEFDKITDVLGYTPYYKSKIFIFNSIADLQQSNVDIENSNVIIGGQTDFFKSLVEVPYTGSEVEFKKELRRGVAQMLIREMMFGGSLKEMVQSSYLGKFSEWFLLGAANYVAEGWSEEMDDHLRDLFNSRRPKKPNLLSGKDAILVGQSIWNFIAEKYGSSNISSILNLARIIRNERNSIGNALGIKYNTFLEEWRKYYEITARESNENTVNPEFDFLLRRKNRKGFIFNEFKINPEGSKLAYSENRNGKYRVVVQDLRTRKRQIFKRKGYFAINQRFDVNVPLISWRDNSNLGILWVRKGEAKLSVYNRRKKVNYEKTWFYFNHVSAFDFSDDGNYLIMSADRKGEVDFKTGQNDIFIFNTEDNNLEQITDDWYDDVDPSFLPNSSLKFIFSSNRPIDTLANNLIRDRGNFNEELNNFDLFIYDPTVSKTRLNRLTNSGAVETQPRLLDRDHLVYLSDENGILQLKKINTKTFQSSTLTNYNQSIRTFALNPTENGLAYLTLKKGRLFPKYKRNFDFNTQIKTDFSTARTRVLKSRNSSIGKETPQNNVKIGFTDSSAITTDPTEVYENDEVDTDNYKFDDDILKDKQSSLEKTQEAMREKIKNLNDDAIKVRGPFDYKPIFRNDNLLTSVQIDPLRGWGMLLSVNTTDLLENHKIKGGFFLLTDLRNSDFFGEYQFLARRLDFSLRFDRRRFSFNSQAGDAPFTQRHTLNKWQATVSYPFNNLGRISVSPFYANTIHTYTGDFGGVLYPVPDNKYHYSGVKIEYVYDDTRINGQNMIVGTRIKVYYENWNNLHISRNVRDLASSFNINLKNNEYNFDKLVVDARKYFRIHRDLILATRITYGRFGGNQTQVFALGGMDNWMFNRNDGGRPEPAINPTGGRALDTNWILFNQQASFSNENLLFVDFVTNLRGFNYAKLSGREYLLGNVELRFPIVKYLFGKRINSNFFNNLQLVGFYDMGTAWTGANPFKRTNSLNTRTVGGGDNPFFAIINDFKNPWLASYGTGLRTVMLGYYLKFDLAWGVEDYIVAKRPRLHVSFGYDF